MRVIARWNLERNRRQRLEYWLRDRFRYSSRMWMPCSVSTYALPCPILQSTPGIPARPAIELWTSLTRGNRTASNDRYRCTQRMECVASSRFRDELLAAAASRNASHAARDPIEFA